MKVESVAHWSDVLIGFQACTQQAGGGLKSCEDSAFEQLSRKGTGVSSVIGQVAVLWPQSQQSQS